MSVPAFAVVGHPNKGKSSIVATLAADDSVRIGAEPGTTVRCRRYPMQVDGVELYVLVDTPGFQRARRALQWMRQHETSADLHPEVVRRFVDVHHGGDRFPDECELLTPLIEGAGILYVVDGSVPYGVEYEPEMEILRWTGQPSLALINPIGEADHVESWRAALGQYFKVVRVFDAVMAEFDKRIELLRAFGQLREAWRQPLERAVGSLQQERERQARRSARAIAECLVDMLGLQVEEKIPVDTDPSTVRAGVEQRYTDALRRREQRCRDEVEQVYCHRRIERREEHLQLLDADLFAERTWMVFGLGRREIMTTGAIGGAATGAVVDAHLGGASLLAGSLLGAGIGAVMGWWTAQRLVRIRVMDMPLGGKRLVAGPTKNLSFPYVVLNRARYHHVLVARRSHAVREELRLTEPSEAIVPPLGQVARKRLESQFKRLRKNRDKGNAIDALADAVLEVFLEDEGSA